MTCIKLMYVSSTECHPQGFFWNKGIPVQHVNLGTASPSLELSAFINCRNIYGISNMKKCPRFHSTQPNHYIDYNIQQFKLYKKRQFMIE